MAVGRSDRWLQESRYDSESPRASLVTASIDFLNMPSPPIQVFLTTIASQPVLRKRQGQSRATTLLLGQVESRGTSSQSTSCAFYRPRRSRSLLTTWLRTKTPNACGRERLHLVCDVEHDNSCSGSDLAQISSSYPVYSSGAGFQVCVDYV